MRWGIIGCGAVTEVKSGPAYQLTDGFELTAVMRRDHAKAKDYAERHNVPLYFDNADQLIHSDDVDAVYIATPPDSHLDYALKVANANKPCCIEKPMAPRYQDCVSIRDAFAAKQLDLFVAYYRRSLPRFQQVKAWLAQIGDVRHVSWQYCKAANELDLSKRYNWRTDASIAYAGYFDDLASHGLDLMTYLLGDVIEASGIAVNQQGLYSAKDAVTGSWLHKNGVTGSGSWNFASYTYEDQLSIYGSEGKISFPVFGEGSLSLSNAQGLTEKVIENPKHIQQYHVENIQKHLSGKAQHPSTGKTATHSSWLMDKILGRI